MVLSPVPFTSHYFLYLPDKPYRPFSTLFVLRAVINADLLSTLKPTLQIEFDGDGVCCIMFDGMSIREKMHFCEKFGCVEVIEGLGKHDRTSIVANQALVFCILSYYRTNANIY